MRGSLLLGCLLARAAVFGAVEFRPGDFYTLGGGGSRHPLAPADMAGEFIRVGGAPAKCVLLKGVKPGRYHVRVTRAAAESAGGESALSPLYLNGQRLDYVRATSPQLLSGEGSPEVDFAETGLVTINEGDILSLYARPERAERERRCRVRAIAITEEPLEAAWLKLEDYEALGRFGYLEWRPSSRMVAGRLDIAFANLLGRPVPVTLNWRITDYWQKEVASGTRQVKVDDGFSDSIPFPAGECHQYRAEVTVCYPDGHVEHRRYACDAPQVRGFHRRYELNECPWEVAWTTDDGTLATRELRDRPPEGVLWRKVTLPDLFTRAIGGKPSYQRWYRTAFVLPTAYEGERVFFSYQWCNCVNRLFINGRLVGESDLARQMIPGEFDITPYLRRGETNRILLATQGCSAAYPKAALASSRVLSSSDAVLGSALMGYKMVFLDPAIESRPARAIDSLPRVMCSYRERSLEVVDPPLPEKTSIRYRVLFRGEEVVPAFHGKVKWENPPLWGPDAFPLLELEATLTDQGKGDVLDRLSTRFGFREIWTEGDKLIWNGRRVKGVSRACGTFPYGYSTKSKQETLDRFEPFRRLGNLIMSHTRATSATYDFCDELGILARKTSGLCFVTLSEPEISSDELWRTAEACAKATVDALPNHPSLYCWYLGNESEILIHKRFGMVPRVKALHDAVRAYDPTRFAEYGSDADADGVLPVCNIHYPYYDVLREETTFMPEMCYFHRFDQPLSPGLKIPAGQSKTLSCIGPGQNIIPYGEKPMIIHETAWDRQMEPPHPASRFAGEDAYNSALGTSRLHHEWMTEYLRGHRDADPYAITPWLNFISDDLSRYFPLLDVFTLERWTHVYEGTHVSYQTDVCHDVLDVETVTFSWRLVDAKGTRVAGGTEAYSANGGELFRTKMSFVAPKPGPYVLEYGAKAGQRRVVRRQKVVVAAKELGERACADLAAAKNVIRATDPLDAGTLKRAEAGETLIVLPRKDYPSALGLSLSQRTPAIGFTFRCKHPILSGVEEDGLRYWYPAHRIAQRAFFKPASGGWQSVIEAGGRQGLVYSLVLLRKWGKGTIVLTRLDLDPGQNPVAAKLVRNLLAYRGEVEGGRVGVSDNALLEKLKSWGVDAHRLTDGKGDVAIYLVGDEKPPSGFSNKIIVHNPGRSWGVTQDSAHLHPWYRGRAVIARRDPVLDGLTNADFFWRARRDDSPISVNFTDPSLAIAELGPAEVLGAVDLTYPRFIARRGAVVFETLGWCSGMMRGDEPERIITTLLANLGVRVTPPASELAPPENKAVARANPAKADQLVAEAIRQKKLRAWMKAIALLKEANENDPLRVSIHREIGDCYALMGDDVNALKWYELSKKIDDNQPRIWDLIKATRARLDCR